MLPTRLRDLSITMQRSADNGDFGDRDIAASLAEVPWVLLGIRIRRRRQLRSLTFRLDCASTEGRFRWKSDLERIVRRELGEVPGASEALDHTNG